MGDSRAGEVLADLLRQQHYFYELFGFLALAGDARSVVLLLQATMSIPKEQKMDPSMALIGVAHRIGREALLAELARATTHGETRGDREAAADAILANPVSYAEAHFELFYHGFPTDNVTESREPRSR